MKELRARCPKCMTWFVVEDPKLDAHFLCPTCLAPADWTLWHELAEDDEDRSRHGEAS